MVRREHTHTILTLLGLLALLLLAVSVAGASGWQEGDGVRYRTYRTPPPYPLAGPGSTVAATPLLWVTPEGRVTHLALRLDSAFASTAGWSDMPLLWVFEAPSCTATGRKGDPE